ncbi:hypothetical protein [Elizabethkingia phage TCUEAP3]|nr:hypothetical protein [Elizabethkingia phage TCUEAP3]
MKNLIKNLYCKTVHKSTPVEDVDSHKKEIAISYQFLGFIFKINYKPL